MAEEKKKQEQLQPAEKENTKPQAVEPEKHPAPEPKQDAPEPSAEVKSEDALKKELKEELKQELKQELEQELRHELVVGLGREVSSTGRRLFHGLRKLFFPTEKEILVQQLNGDALLRYWDVKFSDAHTYREIESLLQKSLSSPEKSSEMRLHCEAVKAYRRRRSKKLMAEFVLNAIAHTPAGTRE